MLRDETSVAPFCLAIFFIVKAAFGAPKMFRSFLAKALKYYERVIWFGIDFSHEDKCFRTKDIFAAYLSGLMIDPKYFEAFDILSKYVGRPECTAIGMCGTIPPVSVLEELAQFADGSSYFYSYFCQLLHDLRNLFLVHVKELLPVVVGAPLDVYPISVIRPTGEDEVVFIGSSDPLKKNVLVGYDGAGPSNAKDYQLEGPMKKVKLG